MAGFEPASVCKLMPLGAGCIVPTPSPCTRGRGKGKHSCFKRKPSPVRVKQAVSAFSRCAAVTPLARLAREGGVEPPSAGTMEFVGLCRWVRAAGFVLSVRRIDVSQGAYESHERTF